MNSDPASLAGLHDILLVPAPGWWPLASGWYVLALLMLVLVLWWAIRAWQAYRRNRYRRAALLELDDIKRANDPDSLRALPALLKRTAIQAYSRQGVAALNQAQWLAFLDQHCAATSFVGPVGESLLLLAYQGNTPGEGDSQALIQQVDTWIRQHEVSPC